MKTLTRYLKDAAILEGQMYTQNWIINTLQQRISVLGIRVYYKEPVRRPWSFEFWGDSSFFLLPFLGISLVYELFSEIVGDGSFFTIARDVFQTVAPVAIMEIVLRNVYHFIRHNTSDLREYREKVSNFNAAVAADNQRVQQELIIKMELEMQLQQVMREKTATENTLNTLYSLDVIHPKYRYLVAVSSFYDYFDTGRCTAFTGPGGAYAVYEEDLRFQRLETKLDVIISKLDELINKQRMLAELMREANNTLYRIEQSNNSMMQSVSQIKENTEVIEYNSRCAMQSSAVMEHIMVYNVLK